MNDELARRLDAAGARFMVHWLGGAAAANGNPGGFHIEQFGKATAIASTAHPDQAWMNTVHGLHVPEASQLPAILAFYKGLDIRPRFELIAEDGYESIAGPLAAAGFAQTGFRAMYYGEPVVAKSGGDDVRVRSADADDIDTFAAVHLEGFDVPEAARPEGRLNLLHWATEPGWLLYLAEVDKGPAGEAVLQIANGIGYLANASTIPSKRRRGVQGALLRARIVDAAFAGCQMIASQTVFGSASARNIERAGLRFAFPKAVWDQIG